MSKNIFFEADIAATFAEPPTTAAKAADGLMEMTQKERRTAAMILICLWNYKMLIYSWSTSLLKWSSMILIEESLLLVILNSWNPELAASFTYFVRV